MWFDLGADQLEHTHHGFAGQHSQVAVIGVQQQGLTLSVIK